MTKIQKTKYKVSRRLGTSIWGDTKDPVHTKNYRPGQHGRDGRIKLSDYGIHLKEKQKLKSHYGRITEKQFKNTFLLAREMKENTIDSFISLLERRLDVVVYRLNFATTIFDARQLVSHCHITVDGKKVNIPSFRVKNGSVISLTDQAKKMTRCLAAIQKKEREIPSHMVFDEKNLSATFIQSTNKPPYPFEVNVGKVVEYYSR